MPYHLGEEMLRFILCCLHTCTHPASGVPRALCELASECWKIQLSRRHFPMRLSQEGLLGLVSTHASFSSYLPRAQPAAAGPASTPCCCRCVDALSLSVEVSHQDNMGMELFRTSLLLLQATWFWQVNPCPSLGAGQDEASVLSRPGEESAHQPPTQGAQGQLLCPPVTCDTP